MTAADEGDGLGGLDRIDTIGDNDRLVHREIAREFDAAEREALEDRPTLPTAFVKSDRVSIVADPGERIDATASVNLKRWR